MSDHLNRAISKRRRIISPISSSEEDEPIASTSGTTPLSLVPSTSTNESSELAGVVKNLVKIMELQTERPSQKLLGLRDSVVPKFNPEDRRHSIDKWCQRIDELKNIYKWSDEVTVYSAISKLDGLANTWYRSLPTVQYTWEEWKIELKKAFPPKRDFFGRLQEMIQRTKRHHESYIVYYYEKTALLNECKIVGSDAVSCIIGGISDATVRAAARANDYANCEALLHYLKTCDISEQSTSKPDRYTFQKRQKHFTKKRIPMKKEGRSTCFRCGTPGHVAADCRVPKCFTCQGYGHRAQDCKTRKQPKNTASSGCNLVRLSNAKDLNLAIDTETDVIIKGYGLSSVKAIGKVTINVKIDDVDERELDFLVVPDHLQEIPILIGQQYTEQSGLVVTKNSKELRFHEEQKDTLNKKKIALWLPESAFVPSNHIGNLTVVSKVPFEGDLLIDACCRYQPGKEYAIPRVIVHVNKGTPTILPIINLSGKDLQLSSKVPIARAFPCQLDTHSSQESVLRLDYNTLPPLIEADIDIGTSDEAFRAELIMLLQDFCEKHNIRHILNAVATPRANGQVERINRTILSALTTTSITEHQWDSHVDQIQFSINNTIHQITKKSPYQLLMGYTPREKEWQHTTSAL
ncbi:hypothetical protein NQ317_005556 [Molorchus minor]|uniref:Endonuclease n=1 Tax=Molorchus minor TaxID=1323400 RepID=A0ABQ9JYV5_9CUCU|nr:hypothetical protein NQ317_005556 [Molorchus minor]